MVEIAFPADPDVYVVDVTLAIEPSGATVRSPFTGQASAVRFGPGVWTGTVTLAALSVEAAREVEAWLAALDGGANVTPVPVHRPAADIPAGTTVDSVAASDGRLVTTLSQEAMDARAGEYVRIGTRLFVVAAVEDASNLILSPQWRADDGEMVTPGLTVRAARRADGRDTSVRTPDFWGPWTLAWTERP
ncbi:hypothetical protein [Candidatus Palauibacter sp.]|uniref:hypothetical protein n=1 Tax=Candidatus Palauibacter sp. TaxID=3101350 RepID=UPI003CC6313B